MERKISQIKNGQNSDTEAIEKNGFCWYYLKLKTSPYIKK